MCEWQWCTSFISATVLHAVGFSSPNMITEYYVWEDFSVECRWSGIFYAVTSLDGVHYFYVIFFESTTLYQTFSSNNIIKWITYNTWMFFTWGTPNKLSFSVHFLIPSYSLGYLSKLNCLTLWIRPYVCNSYAYYQINRWVSKLYWIFSFVLVYCPHNSISWDKLCNRKLKIIYCKRIF